MGTTRPRSRARRPGRPADELATLRRLLATTDVGLAVLDADLRFVVINDALAAINGLPVADHLGQTPMDLLPGIEPDAFAALRSVLATGAPLLGVEVRGVTPARPGVRRTWREDFRPLRAEDGAVVGIEVTCIEVTAERAMEAGLAARTRRIEGLQELAFALAAARTEHEVAETVVDAGLRTLDAVRGGVGFVDEESGELTLIASRGYGEVGRFTRHIDQAGDPWVDVARGGATRFFETHDAFAAAYPAAAGARPGGGGALALVGLPAATGPAGALVLTWGGDRAFDDDERAYVATLARVCAQALERVRLVAREREGRRLLAAVLEQMPIGVKVATADGRELLANARAGRVLGGATEPRGFRPDGRLYATGDWPLGRSLATGEVVTAEEITIERPDGSRGVIEASSAPVLDEDGVVVAGVAMYADVTDRVDAARLREAFVEVLTHELRTPITSILGAAVTLRRHADALPALDRDLVADLVAEADRLRRFIEDLVIVARVDRGGTLAAAEPVALRHVALAAVAAERGRQPAVPFHLAVADGLPPVHGDAALIQQVLRNLLENAAKYGGGAAVDVVVEPAGETEVVVRVLDRGPGIAADEVATLFELFYRSPVAARATPGTGIGLFVSRAIVEAIDGRIWARPRDGGGAEFGFALPAMRVEGD